MDEYISREAAVRYLKGFSEKELNSRGNFGMITSSVLNKAERAISEMPTADVQPVKHGRWKLRCYGDYPYCSSCNNEPKSREMTLYCPNCGARMDGDSE
jgi:NADH pyrophosphatase NudC (nudix superfamily)